MGGQSHEENPGNPSFHRYYYRHHRCYHSAGIGYWSASVYRPDQLHGAYHPDIQRVFGYDQSNIARLDNALAGIEAQRDAAREELENAKQQFATAQEQVERPFPQEDELKAKSARLDELNIALNLDKRDNEDLDDGEELPKAG